MIEVRARGIRFGFDARTGLLDGFAVEDEGREIAPLHRAPWAGTDETMPPDTPPHLETLGGDFFCAPYAGSEDDSPIHGWTANSRWDIAAQEPGLIRATLRRPVQGATVVKELSVSDGHPIVYQRHVFIGGRGSLAVANHANVSLPRGGFIRCSPKSAWQTPPQAPEPDPARGRSGLAYPARSEDPSRFPGSGGPVDLTRFPWNPRHEDVVAGIEEPGRDWGWTAVTRPAEGDLFLSLRNATALPMTVLWHSNGGRDYPPWSGRHFGCLGVEEAAAARMFDLSDDDRLAGHGALALHPWGVSEVRHAIGAIAWPSGEPVAAVRRDGPTVEVLGEGGASRRINFSEHFLD